MLVWLDIETTGLEPTEHEILEIGFIITDDNLAELGRASWVLPFNGTVDKFIDAMHTQSGLLYACNLLRQNGTIVTCWEIRQEISAWLGRYLDVGEKPPLCGSSVGFDKSFLAASAFSPLLERFHYRTVDVSSVKELARRWAPSVYESRPKDRHIHRALPDLEDSIAEAKHYREHLFK